MDMPLELVFRNMDHSDALEERVRERVGKLERHFDHINSIHVAVERVNRQHNKGDLYRVRIEVRVPGDELVVSQQQDDRQEHEDPYIAVRDAFKAAERRIDDFIGKLRAKTRQPKPTEIG